jgi:hypothetical protein
MPIEDGNTMTNGHFSGGAAHGREPAQLVDSGLVMGRLVAVRGGATQVTEFDENDVDPILAMASD